MRFASTSKTPWRSTKSPPRAPTSSARSANWTSDARSGRSASTASTRRSPIATSATMQMPVANIGEFDENDQLYPGHRWHAVMHTVVAAARAYGLRAIDGPFAGYRDVAGLERMSKIARVMGFDGKQCIHPAQIAI